MHVKCISSNQVDPNASRGQRGLAVGTQELKSLKQAGLELPGSRCQRPHSTEDGGRKVEAGAKGAAFEKSHVGFGRTGMKGKVLAAKWRIELAV